jgi:UDP-glucose 4-epimerase
VFHNIASDTDVVFLTAAIARTPWCIDDPLLCYHTNVIGALNVLEACRRKNVKRVVLSSSNVVYAFDTPYRTSKEALERLGDTYVKMYGQSVISLRYSNVYGPRQLETGPSPNVFAALRKAKRELGKLLITGDGEQSRDFTHVYDIAAGNCAAALSNYCGTVDLCTGVNTSLNTVAKYFNCPVEYIPERPGDIKHIVQDPNPAKEILGWEAQVKLAQGIRDVL